MQKNKKLSFEDLMKTDVRFLVLNDQKEAERLSVYLERMGIDFCWIGYHKNEDGTVLINQNCKDSVIFAVKDTCLIHFKVLKAILSLDDKVHYYPEPNPDSELNQFIKEHCL